MPQIDAEPKNAAAADDLWYKDAIIYQLHVKAFADTNGDGIGDFAGLTEKLGYLQDLGVNTLWLLPFYPSPGRDDGYDIGDYGDINPQFGTMKDFRRFMTEAKRRGLRVITELVVNHTSDQHAWFKRARRSPAGSSARDWYVWSDTDQKYLGTRIIFTDTEKSNWAWDPEAKAYYWHRFFSHQPDLNFDNPRVVSAVVQVMKRWLDTGVDGFRLDAVPYLIERDGTSNENLPETHQVIRHLRKELDAYAPGKVLLAEANMWPEDVQQYFGDGDECQMAYHFPLMPRIYMAIAQEDRFPIADIMRQTPDIPANCQWAMFLRNHDELTLEMVTDVERDYLWSTYAADPRARINLGIRRRLAPLMDNDRRKIELMNSILMSMPGTPIIYYGDEIGMGDNIYLGDRNGVRTPMQWTPDRNGGFSKADPAQLYLPAIQDAVYGFQAVNVEAQSRSMSSLLSWTKRLIAVRKSSKVFGRGSLTFVRPANRTVLAYVRQYENEAILCVCNLSRAAQAVELDMSAFKGRIPQEMLGRTRFPRIGELPYLITLPPYGFFWFLLCDSADERPQSTLPREVTTLVIGEGWDALLHGRGHRALELDVLPSFIGERRWFGGKAHRLHSTQMRVAVPVQHEDNRFLLSVVHTAGAEPADYMLPLTIGWQRYNQIENAGSVLAAVRRGPREGALLDASTEPAFIRMLVSKMHAGGSVGDDKQSFEFRPSQAFAATTLPPFGKIKALGAEQSNTSVLVEGIGVVKVLRRITGGTHPEVEMGRYLADEAQFANAPRLLGSVELVENGERHAVAVMHEHIENQGDAWSVISASLDRLAEEERLLADDSQDTASEGAILLQRMRQIGKRTAEMHQALARDTDDPAFKPEDISADDAHAWRERLTGRLHALADMLGGKMKDIPENLRSDAQALIDKRHEIAEHIGKSTDSAAGTQKIRHHGDFHLGQILIAKDDAYILDFEGEPRRSLDERRQKAPAARDVAGFLRSIDYATTSAIDRLATVTPEERARLEPRLQSWSQRLEDAFLAGYRETATQSGLWPKDRDRADELLRFFVLEKALYEIEYELTNRPGWLHVPLSGTWRILERYGVTK